MSWRINKLGTASQTNPRDILIVSERDELTGQGSSSRTEEVTKSLYSGAEPNLLPTCNDIYSPKTAGHTLSERRYSRIPCRNVNACIKTERGSSVLVNVTTVSRCDLSFTSSVEFCPGTRVSVATHFIEGGQNIFRDGRIVRIQSNDPAKFLSEYVIEFLM